MPTTIPAIEGKIGTTPYWVVTMKCKELTERLTIPKDVEGWEELSIGERYQRDINSRRVLKDIAPYFAHDKDRFTGSLIVAVQNHEKVEFESMQQIVKSLPALYKSAASGLGLLTLSGEEILIPLDGQHRTKALKYAITGRDDNGKDIEKLEPDPALAKEDIVVILVRFDTDKSRKIFNKVNRYAKPTSKGENLITDDDDIIAVITRGKVLGGFIDSRLVRIESNTLSKTTHEFTTLATLYECNKAIVEAKDHYPMITSTNPAPSDSAKKLVEDELSIVWKLLTENITIFSIALADPSESGDDKRREIRAESILGKPIGQRALVKAFLSLEAWNDKSRQYSPTELCERLNKINWNMDDPMWQGVLMAGEKIMAGNTVVNLASDFISYCAGQKYTKTKVENIEERIRANTNEESYYLPEPIK